MKKNFFTILSSLVMLLMIAIIITEPLNAETPDLNLPPSTVDVRMLAKYGTVAWFDMILSGIPEGYDITNGVYQGWCIQEDVYMIRNVNHAIVLYSSYDPDMPENYKDEDWNKVNYVINNKNGYNKDSIQEVIWYYIDESDTSDPDAIALIEEANQYSDFIPKPGELIAILVEGYYTGNDTTIQRTFLELEIPAIPTQASLDD